MSEPWIRHEHPTFEAADDHHSRFSEVTHSFTDIKFDEEKQTYRFYTKYWGNE